MPFSRALPVGNDDSVKTATISWFSVMLASWSLYAPAEGRLTTAAPLTASDAIFIPAAGVTVKTLLWPYFTLEREAGAILPLS